MAIINKVESVIFIKRFSEEEMSSRYTAKKMKNLGISTSQFLVVTVIGNKIKKRQAKFHFLKSWKSFICRKYQENNKK